VTTRKKRTTRPTAKRSTIKSKYSSERRRFLKGAATVAGSVVLGVASNATYDLLKGTAFNLARGLPVILPPLPGPLNQNWDNALIARWRAQENARFRAASVASATYYRTA
jgi:hypothetical protein